MAQIISHRGVRCHLVGRAPSLLSTGSSLLCRVWWVLQAALVASAALQEAAMSAPFCSAAVHFRECQVERRKWRGSLTINIWGALVAAAVYLTEHAPGLPWRARHRGADSTTLSLTPPALHPPSPHPPSLMGAMLLPVSFPEALSPPSSITIPSYCFLTVNLCRDCHYFSFVQPCYTS